MNILIDTNYVSRKAAWVRSTGPDYLSKKEDRDDMIQSVLWQINAIVKRYQYVNRIIFCFDSVVKSWRFRLPYHEIYKSSRKSMTSKYDIVGFKQTILEMQQMLESRSYCTMMFPEAEADDLLYIASNILFNADESSLICTADADMRQLIRSEGNKFIFVFNNDSAKAQTHFVDKLNISNDTEIMSVEAFFDEDVERINKQVIYSKCDQIIPQESLFVKILAGDKSDTIPSCYFYDKGTMHYGFTDKRALSVFDKFYRDGFSNKSMTVESITSDNDLLRQLAINVITEVDKKNSNDEAKIIDCISKIKTNISYIHLDYSVYNPEFYDKMEGFIIGKLENYTNCENFDKLINND